MNFVLQDLTMVVAGSWNVGIFQPPWLSAHIFNGQNLNMEMQLGAVAPVLRYHAGRSTLLVQPDMIIGSLRDESLEASTEVSTMLQTILGILSHTPVNAVGINFGFREVEPTTQLLANFAVADNQKIIQLGCEIKQTTIVRELSLDGSLLRLQETLEDAGSAHFHLNFHYDVVGAAAAAAVLANNAIPKRTKALELMQAVYELEPEPNNAN